MSYNPEDLPRTDGLELALLSEAENAEDYRDLWGTILDDEVFKKIDNKLTNGEADLDVASVSTDEAAVGQNPDRPLISNSDTTVTVPGDYATIQAAIDDCPLFLRHDYHIDVDAGTYSEDLLIDGVIDMGFESNGDENQQLVITGDKDTPSNVEINSVTAVGCVGVTNPQIAGFSLSGVTPYEDVPTTFASHGCGLAMIYDCEFRGPGGTVSGSSVAMTCYNGGLHTRRCDVGVDNYNRGLYAKHAAKLSATDNAGTVTEWAYDADENSDISIRTVQTSDKISGPEPNRIRQGRIIDTGGIEVRDGSPPLVDGSNQRGLDATRSGDGQIQPIPSQTWTTLEFPEVNEDDFGAWDSSNNRWVAPEAGWYQVESSVHFNSPDDQDLVQMCTYDYSTDDFLAMTTETVSGDDTAQTVSTSRSMKLDEGDPIEAQAWHDNGSSLDTSDSPHYSYLTITKIG